MHRKEFIKLCGITCLCSVSPALLLQACGSSSHYASSTISGKELSIKKSEFMYIKNSVQEYRKYVIVRNDNLKFPICIFRKDSNAFTALSMECTHNSCELQANGDYLVCPCHGSEFSNTGVVQNPPAETNLKSYTIKTDNETIYIQL